MATKIPVPKETPPQGAQPQAKGINATANTKLPDVRKKKYAWVKWVILLFALTLISQCVNQCMY